MAALGIVIRGAAYAVSAGTSGPRQVRELDFVSAISSIVTPFALGGCVGGIASGRVPYDTAQGDLVSSWLNPTSAVIGALAIAISAYLAAVYLCDDAQRRGEHALVAPYRRRALGAGTVAGLLAVAGLGVLQRDAHPLYRELIAGPGLPAVIVSGAAGVLWGAGELVIGRGVIVRELSADSPLRAETPLREGDAVWRIGGRRVTSVEEIDDAIRQTPAGAHVTLSVISHGEHVEWPGLVVTEEMRRAPSPSGITGGGPSPDQCASLASQRRTYSLSSPRGSSPRASRAS